MSTLWDNYNEFMGAWAHEDADKDILAMIAEHDLFKKCTDFEYEKEVNQVFDHLDFIAEQVEAEQITAAGASIAADACALAAVFSFGMSMGPFLVLEGTALAFTALAASEQGDLTKAMKSADDDIADKIGKDSNVAKWIKQYKANNDMIVSYCGKDQATKEARKILFQFMAGIEAHGRELTLENFHLFANSCRLLWNSDTRDIVSDALDKLNFSSHSQQDVEDCLKALKNYSFTYLGMAVQPIFFSMAIGFVTKQLNVTDAAIRISVEKGILPESALEDSALEAGELVGRGGARILAGIAGIISVLDIFFEVYHIVEAVEQAKKIRAKLDDTMRPRYLEYFGNIKGGALEYNNTVVLFHKKVSIAICTVCKPISLHGTLENVKLGSTVNAIKLKLIEEHFCPAEYSWIWLTFKGIIMNEDNRSLFSYGVGTDGNFDICLYCEQGGPDGAQNSK